MSRPFIVAEMSANHLGSIDRAKKIIEAAAWAGADAIKFQTWRPELMVADESIVIQHGPWAGRNLAELYRECYTPPEWHETLFIYAKACGLEPFSTAFDRPSVDFLESLGVARHKIASFELVDVDLIAYAASKGKPLILSTGMASEREIDRAVDAGMEVPITLLRCISAYPASPGGMLSRTDEWYDWGLSDHTLGIGVSVAAVALGARYIEKHLTLSRSDGGPDAGFSLEPGEFAQLVRECKSAWSAVNDPPNKDQESAQRWLRRSLWWTRDLPEGHILRDEDIQASRPADGLPCAERPYLIGVRLRRPVSGQSPVQWDDLSTQDAMMAHITRHEVSAY